MGDGCGGNYIIVSTFLTFAFVGLYANGVMKQMSSVPGSF